MTYAGTCWGIESIRGVPASRSLFRDHSCNVAPCLVASFIVCSTLLSQYTFEQSLELGQSRSYVRLRF